eukprot:5355850-Pyramimonas_sp.AAC.1
MDAQMRAKLFPVMKELCWASFTLRMPMVSEFAAAKIPEESDLIQAGFQAGRARATWAAWVRAEHQADPKDKALPEVTMGPARAQ